MEPDHLIGRSSDCSLVLDEAYVSSRHACLRYSGEFWHVRDLGSRNGTFVDGRRLRPGEQLRLERGARLAFGRPEQEWHLEDDGPPRAMLVPLMSKDAEPLEGDVIGLPSAENPVATVYRGPDGRWMLERSEDPAAPIGSGEVIEVEGRAYRFSCPEVVALTTMTEGPAAVGRLQLIFAVSRDEEHVELSADVGGKKVSLGSRGHNYLLLTLARHRLADREQNLPETSSGWVYQDDLLRELDTHQSQLNIDIFRIRRQFAGHGFPDAASVIERRPRTKQIRIGVADLTVRIL